MTYILLSQHCLEHFSAKTKYSIVKLISQVRQNNLQADRRSYQLTYPTPRLCLILRGMEDSDYAVSIEPTSLYFRLKSQIRYDLEEWGVQNMQCLLNLQIYIFDKKVK